MYNRFYGDGFSWRDTRRVGNGSYGNRGEQRRDDSSISNRFSQDRFGDRRINHNRFDQSRGFIEEEGQQAVYYSIDEVVGVRPKTEISFGLKDKAHELGREHEIENPPKSPYISLFFSDGRYRCVSKVYFSGNQEDITKQLIDYLNRVKKIQLDYMKQINSGRNIRGVVITKGSSNEALDILEEYVKAEEFAGYMLG